MMILHIDLKLSGSDRVELRLFSDNPNQTQPEKRSLTEIQEQINIAERDYYFRLAEDSVTIGQALYSWLDGDRRILATEINKYPREVIVLAINSSEQLANLPWELLYDGQNFLVNKPFPVIPIRWVKTTGKRQLNFSNNEPPNRPLNVLFMASSARGVEPELGYEAEEAKILQATKGKPICLDVEESGCLKELSNYIATRRAEYFDIIHLSGHATINNNGQPYLITENEYGGRVDSSAEDIARNLTPNLRRIPLIFLSGCRTGYSNKLKIPAMAEALVNEGANAVLAWGKPVIDHEASDAAAILYEKLCQGVNLIEALEAVYQELFTQQARDWHCLRLYIGGSMPQALVQRGRRGPLPRVSIAEEFVDPETRHLRVATRESFVGRRRELQDCLQVLKRPFANSINQLLKVGVLIQGMGGNGKSTIAARFADRLSDYQPIVWWRQVDETALLTRLCDQLKLNKEQREAIQDSEEILKLRLYNILAGLEKPLLLIFDDFEWNLDPSNPYPLKPEVATLMEALIRAIKETNYYHRIIITCRYKPQSSLIDREFYALPSLRSLSESGLEKKLRQLENFDPEKTDQEYINRALKLADGNPRLLEWLNEKVLNGDDIDTKLTHYEQQPEEWRGKVVWVLENEPILQTDEHLNRVVSNCQIYKIPVPIEALEAICKDIPNHKEKLIQAQNLGLIEADPETKEERLYRAFHIPKIIPGIEIPEDGEELWKLARNAYNQIDNLWGNRIDNPWENTDKNEKRWKEIFRLLFIDENNSERFREGFLKMLSLLMPGDMNYTTKIVDLALENQLKKINFQRCSTNLYNNLEKKLQEKQWKSADEETAWIFYQITVIEGERTVHGIRQNFPVQELQEIDRLWREYSNNKFGFIVQKEIWESLGATLFDIEYGPQDKIINLITEDRIDDMLHILAYNFRNNTNREDVRDIISQLRTLNPEEIKARLVEFLKEDDQYNQRKLRGIDNNRIRECLKSIIFNKFENRVNWPNSNDKKSLKCLTENITQEEAVGGQFPVRCFTQDLYNGGYHNDTVRYHQLLWEFGDFWSSLGSFGP